MPIPPLWLLIAGCYLAHSGNHDLVYQLDKEVIALRQRIKHLEAAQESCGEDHGPSPIYAELVQIMPQSQAQVSREGAVTIVTIPVSGLFPSGKLRLRSESGMVLDLLATALNLHPDAPVTVMGFGDDSPVTGSMRRYYPSNWEIAGMRAAAVVRTLIDSYEVDPYRLTVASRGPLDPVAENDTPEGRADNRRIVIRIYPAPSEETL